MIACDTELCHLSNYICLTTKRCSSDQNMIFSCQLRQQNSWFGPKLKTKRNIFRPVYFCSSHQIFPVALSSAAVSQSNWRPNQTCQIRLEPELYICPQSGQMLNWTLATDADTQHKPPQLSISFVGLLSKVNILHKKILSDIICPLSPGQAIM